MFEKISIMGRVIYIIYFIECYLQKNEDVKKWRILLDALWSFPEYEKCIDNYAYKIIECKPESVLDEREDFNTFEYFTETELLELKMLYEEAASTEIIQFLMMQINDILAFNLYTTVEQPETYSLKVINVVYQFINESIRGETPSTEPFEIYSISVNQCWGDYSLGREEVMKIINGNV